MAKNKTLATRMRPEKIIDIHGQDHLLGDGKILKRLIDSDTLSSIILYGSPGIGKTSIAYAIANELNANIYRINASVDGKKELQDIIKKTTENQPTIILIDEIHRLTRPNQDFLLMHIEEGTIKIIGATTENPYMSICEALRSRTHIFELQKPSEDAILKIIERSLNDEQNGYGAIDIDIAKKDQQYLIRKTNHDVRQILNTLELIIESNKSKTQPYIITQQEIDICLNQEYIIDGDSNGDHHYNLLSALQKSIRGSDTDAALHYLTRLIKIGDLKSLERRLLVIAYEDVGLADPIIAVETLTAIESIEKIGLPEAKIILSHIVIRLCLSSKSNISIKAIQNAENRLKNKHCDIPNHLKDAHYKGAKTLGHGISYAYAHDYPYHFTPQNQLPENIKNDQYLEFNKDNNTSNLETRYTMINELLKKTKRIKE